MAALDNGIISAALTTINRSFDVTANWGAWGVTIYTLGLAISIPIIGKLSDRYGRKRLFVIEVALFGIGSLLVALSPNFIFYLVARFIQALGGGGIFIIGSSHILSTFPIAKQGKALGILGGMNGIGAVLGPNLGSIILDLTGNWHYLFLINVPIAIVLMILGILKIEETKEPAAGKLDLLGTIILSFAVLGIMYGLTNIEGVSVMESLASFEVWGFLAIGIILFILLLLYNNQLDTRGEDPILPVRLLKLPVYLLTLLIGALSGALLAGMIFIPAFTEQVLGVAAEYSGYWMTPLALAAGMGAGFGGAFVDKRGPILTVFLSGLLTAIGFILFPIWVDVKWQFVIASSIAGFGMGMILGAPLNILATEKTESNKGTAIAGLSLARQIGMTLAPTLYAGFITRGFNQLPDMFRNDFQEVLQGEMEAENLGPEAMGELQEALAHVRSESPETTDFTSVLSHIENPKLIDVIENSVNQVTTAAAKSGYDGLFMSATVLAVTVIIFAVLLKFVRENRVGGGD